MLSAHKKLELRLCKSLISAGINGLQNLLKIEFNCLMIKRNIFDINKTSSQ